MKKTLREVIIYEQNGWNFVEVEGRLYVRVDNVQKDLDNIINTLSKEQSND